MHSYVLQDWITIRGQSASQVIAQGESAWLDLAPYQDLSLWLDVREVSQTSPAVLMQFQTAPFKEEGLFQAMLATAISITLAPSNPYRVPITTTACPVARYVRWQLTGPTSGTLPWDVTFRVLCAADALGL
jgi:hypothetical protein